jgi:ABC-type antimicrobial peptide transport system permease subunit
MTGASRGPTAAIGASRRQILLQSLVESALLSVMGGLAGTRVKQLSVPDGI